MTAPARITQADIARAAKVVAGLPNARIIMRLDKAEIEIIMGGLTNDAPAEEWSDDDI